MEKLSQKLNACQGSSKLNEILNAQRPPHLKFGLGFEGESSSKQVKQAPQKTKQIAVNVTPPKAISQTQKPKRKLAPPKKMPQQQNFRPPMRIQSTNFRSISHFHGYCFKCNTYGHKMMTCKFNLRPRNFVNRNSFDALMMYPVECFICHNFGHLARNCVYAHDFNRRQVQFQKANAITYEQRAPTTAELTDVETDKSAKSVKKVWKRKEQKDKANSLIVQTAFKAQGKSTA
ncbi:hypothetical protein MRB53_010953 [Persea americana]|uniref:Uncharacterized protein n=1 Tax=Persea americana TaxID=3435 RepID=A0ACC2LT63_PERAE|nr:hypothetical protein MRB53_010953 [Persea americana]